MDADVLNRHVRRARRTLWQAFRNRMIAGLVILIPIVLTVKVFWWLLTYLEGLTTPIMMRLYGRTFPGTGVLITLIVIFVTGVLFSGGPLRRLLDSAEDLLEIFPIVGTIYGTLKKVLSGFGSPQSRQSFQKFVLARLPGRTSPGFLTGTFKLDLADGTTRELRTVYVPTNHLYVGDVVVLPPEDVLETDLSVEEGISILLSAGASVPPRFGERSTSV